MKTYHKYYNYYAINNVSNKVKIINYIIMVIIRHQRQSAKYYKKKKINNIKINYYKYFNKYKFKLTLNYCKYNKQEH